jgi:3-dehydroquinate synthetase
MGQDKKVRRGQLTFILARGIGEAYVAHDVASERVGDFLAGEMTGSAGR